MTYDKLVAKTLKEIKEKVMRMPENADVDTLLKISKHDDGHIESVASFLSLWLWIWERKAVCKERDLFFLLGILQCDACCAALRASPSSVEAFTREDTGVQNLLSDRINKLTGALALAEDAHDELKVNIIKILLSKLEKQQKGEIR
ncbi:MAG: hypothetical protein Q8Q46_01820 [Candidatus Giovannonibacteria bacterium]|nr:hypothetical protein [Candidatus Giovannonibacteria bacterium]